MRIAILIVALQSTAYQRGVALVEEGKHAEAVPYLESAVRDQPRNAQAWKALGVAFASQGNYRSAEPAFGKACEIDRSLPDACYFHGRALYALDRYEESLKALIKAPNTWQVQLGRAEAHDAMRQAREAERLYLSALSASSRPAAAYGKFLVREGRLEDAIRALAPHGKDPEAATVLGRALLESGKPADAVAILEQVLKQQPANGQAHLLLAKSLVRIGDREAARRHFEAAAELERAAGLGR